MFFGKVMNLLFQATAVVCSQKTCGNVAVGTWNVSKSSNPILQVGSLISFYPDHSFMIKNMGVYGSIKLEPPKLYVYFFNAPIPVRVDVDHRISMDRIYLKQGIFEYEFVKCGGI